MIATCTVAGVRAHVGAAAAGAAAPLGAILIQASFWPVDIAPGRLRPHVAAFFRHAMAAPACLERLALLAAGSALPQG
jgi:hypothetical protein